MRKLAILLALSLIIFTGCSAKSIFPGNNSTESTAETSAAQPEQNPGTVEAQELLVSDFFPLTKDVHMKYKGTGNEYAGYETYVDFVRNNKIQIRSINGGTIVAAVYQLQDDVLKKVFSKEEVYYRYDYTASTNQDEVLLQGPIKKGTSWTLKDGSIRSITAVDKEIDTPAGTFRAVEVTTKKGDSMLKSFYVKDVGLVKTEFTANDNPNTIVSELEKIDTGVAYTHKVRFYFPEFIKDRVVYMDRDVEINTNQDMKFKFQKELKTIPKNTDLAKVLSANTQVLSIKLDDKNGTVIVDFSSHLVSEMNAGTSFEGMLLKSIANSVGDYYQRNKVIITVEGKPYSSGHILMKPGEFFKVDKNKVAAYK